MLRKTNNNQRMTLGDRFSITVYHPKYMITEYNLLTRQRESYKEKKVLALKE